eukprot:scaffold57500_cov38-Cyclotella_meneghiniana.AAC.1
MSCLACFLQNALKTSYNNWKNNTLSVTATPTDAIKSDSGFQEPPTPGSSATVISTEYDNIDTVNYNDDHYVNEDYEFDEDSESEEEENLLQPSIDLNESCLASLASPHTYDFNDNDLHHHLHLVECDIFSIAADSFCKATIGGKGIDEYARHLSLFVKINESRMNLIPHARKLAAAKSNERYPLIDSSQAASCVFWAAERGNIVILDVIKEPIVQAAELATDAFYEHKNSRVNWHEIVAMKKQERNVYVKKAALEIQFRVMSDVTINVLSTFNSELENMKPFLKNVCNVSLEKVEDLSVADIYQGLIKASLSTPDHDMIKKVLRTSELLSKIFATKELIPFILLAESVPLDVIYKNCTEEERLAYAARNTRPYFCEKEKTTDGYMMNTCTAASQQRRRECARVPYFSLLCPPLINTMIQHGLLKWNQAPIMSI